MPWPSQCQSSIRTFFSAVRIVGLRTLILRRREISPFPTRKNGKTMFHEEIDDLTRRTEVRFLRTVVFQLQGPPLAWGETTEDALRSIRNVSSKIWVWIAVQVPGFIASYIHTYYLIIHLILVGNGVQQCAASRRWKQAPVRQETSK